MLFIVVDPLPMHSFVPLVFAKASSHGWTLSPCMWLWFTVRGARGGQGVSSQPSCTTQKYATGKAGLNIRLEKYSDIVSVQSL